MTGYQKYPEYKDSGVEWLGEIPAGWHVTQVRRVSECCDYLRIPVNAGDRMDMKGNIPYWGANSIQGYVNKALVDFPAVLVGEDGAPFLDKTKEVSFAIDYPFWPNNHVHVLKAKKSIEYKYLSRALNTVDYSEYIKGSTRQKLNQGEMMGIKIPLPPLDAQKQIVTFLDAETKRIDDSIVSMESLISLLTEKRSALISETVTRGIPGDHTEFKDSGVAWLGKIPLSWKVHDPKNSFTLKSEVPFENDIHLMASQKYGVIPQAEYLRITGKRVVEVFSTEARFKHIDKDDFLIHLRSFQGGIEHCVNTGKVTAAYTVVSPRKEVINPLYAKYLLKSRYYIGGIASTTNQLRDGQSIKWKDFRKIKLPIPHINEQRRIYEYLSAESIKIDALINEAKSSIELLKEKRQTLIFDVVTGNIDVSNENK